MCTLVTRGQVASMTRRPRRVVPVSPRRVCCERSGDARTPARRRGPAPVPRPPPPGQLPRRTPEVPLAGFDARRGRPARGSAFLPPFAPADGPVADPRLHPITAPFLFGCFCLHPNARLVKVRHRPRRIVPTGLCSVT